MRRTYHKDVREDGDGLKFCEWCGDWRPVVHRCYSVSASTFEGNEEGP